MKFRAENSSANSIRQGLALAGLSLFVIGGVAHEASATILIDEFTNKTRTYPASINVDTAGFSGSVETGLAGTVGGARNLRLGNAVMDVDGFDQAAVSVFNGSGQSFFDYNSTVGAVAQAQLQYGNATTEPALNLDATAETDLRIDFIGYDGPINQSLQIQTVITSSAVGSPFNLLPIFISPGGASTAYIPLNTLPPGARADIDGIQITFFVPKSGDFRVDTVSLVPEPASIALLVTSAGVFSLATGRRRR